MDDYPDIQTATLEKLKMAVIQAISPHLLGDRVDIDTMSQFMADEIVLRVTGHIWAEQLVSDEFQWPADWWEAFKERWFPAWAKRRWPVRYERHRLDVKAVYPNLRPSVPDEPYVIHILHDWNER